MSPEFATFVECDPDIDLSTAHAFYYSAQYQHARRVIRLPIDEFHKLAAAIGDPPKGRVVYLYSTGRCGSTLLQQILSGFNGVYSISEPDSFTNVAVGEWVDPEERKRMLRSVTAFETTKVLLQSPAHYPLKRSPKMLVLKFRSQCTPQV